MPGVSSMLYFEMNTFVFNYKNTFISLLKNKPPIHLLSAIVIREAIWSYDYSTGELDSLLCH